MGTGSPLARRIQAWLIALAIFLLAAPARAAVTVDTFTPEGQAKAVRQVAVRFSEPMVAFGDPRLPDPFTVTCEGDASRLKGRGRWADTKNWIYDFENDLPAGQRCKFVVRRSEEFQGGEQAAGA